MILLLKSGSILLADTVATSSTQWLARPNLISLALTLVWHQVLDDYQFSHQKQFALPPPLNAFIGQSSRRLCDRPSAACHLRLWQFFPFTGRTALPRGAKQCALSAG